MAQSVTESCRMSPHKLEHVKQTVCDVQVSTAQMPIIFAKEVDADSRLVTAFSTCSMQDQECKCSIKSANWLGFCRELGGPV